MCVLILRETLEALMSVLFPAPCQICGNVLTNASRLPICSDCLASLAPFRGPCCATCGRPFLSEVATDAAVPLCFACRRSTYGFDGARSYGEYNEQMSRAIGLLKYEKLTRQGAWFAARLEEKVRPSRNCLRRMSPFPFRCIQRASGSTDTTRRN